MAISKLERVPVDTSGMRLWVGTPPRPAVRQERQGGVVVAEQPKVRNGVQGTELDVIVQFPNSFDKQVAKFTIYGDIPSLSEFAEIRVIGELFANVWTSSTGPGGGMWFEVGGLAPVGAAGGSSKGSSDRGAA